MFPANKYFSADTPKRFFVCFDKQTGALIEQVDGSSNSARDVSRWEHLYDLRDPNDTFIATMKILTGQHAYRARAKRNYFHRGVHADLYLLDLASDLLYPMFLEDFYNAIMNADLYQGEITGEWSYKKRGKRQCIELVREIKFDENGNMII